MWWKINREGDCTRNEEPLLAAKCKIESQGIPISFTNKGSHTLQAQKKRNENARERISMFSILMNDSVLFKSQNPNRTIQ